jgi:hypothetical protein
MNDEDVNVEQGFYDRCAELLGVPHTYRKYPYKKRTRWNNRTPGNGRFPGRGLIRLYGESVHVSLRDPAINCRFPSKEACLSFLLGLKQA